MAAHGYDAIVLGLGGMGSAAAYHLARRGKRVLGLEQFQPAHDRGSSHGGSRIIRQAYFESPAYVPLVRRAWELWRELGRESGRELLLQTGGLMIGAPESEVVQGSLLSARTWNLPHRVLEPAELQREYPVLQVAGEIALYEDAAGVLFPEACVLAHVERAAALGADLRFDTPVTGWHVAGDGVAVTAGGESYHAASLVVTAGAWAGRLLRELGLPLSPERNVMLWFEPLDREPFRPGRFPIFIWDQPDRAFYGFPNLRGEGVKAAFHHSGIPVDPDALDREVHEREVLDVRERLARYIPALNGSLLRSAVCMYTNTPDEHFVIGLHPLQPRVAIAAGFSGHGFKFATVVGEILADLTLEAATRYDIAPFAPERLLGAAGASKRK